MRVSTRIIAGFGVVMILALLALLYQVQVNQELQSVTEKLSAINVTASYAIGQLEFDSFLTLQHSKKFFPSDRQVYGDALESDKADFETYLRQLEGLDLTPAEHVEVTKLATLWNLYKTQWPDIVKEYPEATESW